jgi:hypothetical protein
VVVGDHVREELLRELVVADGIDLEGEAQVVVRGVEDGLAARKASVVHQHGGVADFGLDLGGGFFDGVVGAKVGVEVEDVWWDCVSSLLLAYHIMEHVDVWMRLTNKLGFLDIQNHSLHPLASQHLHNLRTNAITTTRDRHNLPAPVIPVVRPVIRYTIIEEALDAVEEAAEDEAAQPCQGGGVLGEEVLALGCVEGGEVDGQGFAWVEGCVLEDGEDGVEGEAWGGSVSLCRGVACGASLSG